MKIICIIIVCYVTIECSVAREISREDNKLDTNSISNFSRPDVSSNSFESRKRKPFHDLFFLARKCGFSEIYLKPLHGIAFAGGLQSLIGFIVIKIKIVLVTIAIIGAVALVLKVFGIFKYSGYFYKNDYSPYPTHPEFHHGYHEPPSYPSTSFDTYGKDWSSDVEHYARSVISQSPITMNATEIMYSVMHVDKDDCKARLVCELETMMTRSPFFNYFMRHTITENHRPLSQNRSNDCSTYYKKCVESTTKHLLRRRRSRVKRRDRR